MVKAMIKKAVGYCRVSSESQVDNTSIENQVEKIKDYCKLYNIELVKMFIDGGESGSGTDKRKAYNDMMDYVKENNINGVIVYKADRIHRKLKNLLIMIEDILEPLNVGFISITESFDTSTSQGMLFLQMVGSFSEFERKIINERTRSGRVKKASDKKFSGGKIPYGYKLIDSDTLELEQVESEVIKDIFIMRKDKLSLKRIADTLNKKGISTRNNKEWSKQTINYILKNEVYTGKYTYDGKTENNNINFKVPKIVSKQLFNIVNS